MAEEKKTTEPKKKRGRPKANELKKPKSPNEKYRQKDEQQVSETWGRIRARKAENEREFADALQRESALWKAEHPGIVYNHRKIQLDEKDMATREAYIDATRGAMLSLKIGQANPCTSDEELKQRIDGYFIACQQCMLVPSMETFALAIGKSLRWVDNVIAGSTVGFSVNTQNILTSAQTILRSILSELALAGKINTVAYIFYSKNNLGMQDEKKIVIAAELNQKSPEQLIAESQMLMAADDPIEGEYEEKDP